MVSGYGGSPGSTRWIGPRGIVVDLAALDLAEVHVVDRGELDTAVARRDGQRVHLVTSDVMDRTRCRSVRRTTTPPVVHRVSDDQIVGDGRDVHVAERTATGAGAGDGWADGGSTTDC